MKIFYKLLMLLVLSSHLFAQSGWTEQNSGTTEVLKSVKFFSNSNGIAAGGDAFLLTTNGGESWTNFVTDTLVKGINSFSFVNSTTGWCIAQAGIIKTTNAGAAWVKQEPYTSGATNKIFFYDANNGWACGPSGALLHTSNGGDEWNAQTSGVSETLKSVFFVSTDKGWAVGSGSTILTTSDGGENWTSQSSGTVSGTFNDVKFVNQDSGWVAGNNGIILTTTNGGANWISKYSTSTDDYECIFFINNNRGWSAGELGTLVYSQNGGNTWTMQGSQIFARIFDVFFINERLGWAVGSNGKIIKSFSSGEFINANFSVDTTIGLRPFTVNFTDKSTGNPTAYSWTFGDGGTSSEKNPTHTYTTAGKFDVGLTITSGTFTSNKTETRLIQVDDLLNAQFSGTPTTGSATLTVQFTDETVSPPDTWYWDFGDGASSTFKNPSHSYEAPGTYSVKLIVTNYQGTDSTIRSNYIVVKQALNAEFSASPTSGPAKLKVNFYDNSLGEPTTFLWNFGDGGTSTIKNPEHTYLNSGTYTVRLRISDAHHNSTKEKENYIIVTDALKADFTASPLSGNLPLTVNFTDQSLGGGVQWGWNFGDNQTSNDQNPSHRYILPGTYTVRLTVTDANSNTDIAEKVNYITVTGTPVLEADFSATPRSGTEPLSVQFTDLTNGALLSRKWQFGDGETSEEISPRHTYKESGFYTVSLIVYNGATRDTMTKENYITVNVDPNKNVIANFNADVREGDKPLEVKFTDLSSGNPTNYAWEFGDGGLSSEKSPTYIYKNSGTFTVSLTVSKAEKSNTATKEYYIWVKTPISVVDNSHSNLLRVRAYPNPFKDFAKIEVNLENSAKVKVEIYDLLGNKVDELINQNLNSGVHQFLFSPEELNYGILFYKVSIFENNEFRTKTGELIYVK